MGVIQNMLLSRKASKSGLLHLTNIGVHCLGRKEKGRKKKARGEHSGSRSRESWPPSQPRSVCWGDWGRLETPAHGNARKKYRRSTLALSRSLGIIIGFSRHFPVFLPEKEL